MIKNAISKSLLICLGLMILAMIASIGWTIVEKGFVREVFYAAPLLGLYVSFRFVVVLFPFLFVGILVCPLLNKKT